MSFIFRILWWVIATSLGIGAIVALEPLWIRRPACDAFTTRRSG